MESSLLIVFVYFFPSIIAALRSKVNANSVFILNLFLGWTLLGWVIALIWALKTDMVDIHKKEIKSGTY